MTKYNHMFTIAFELINNDPKGNATEKELFDALEQRIQNLRNGFKGEIIEATGYPDDTYEIEET